MYSLYSGAQRGAPKKQKDVYKLAHELLRHFWGCFPLATQARKEKMERVLKAIAHLRTKLEGAKAQSSENKLCLPAIIVPLQAAMDHAELLHSRQGAER